MSESAKQANVLTEEELQTIEKHLAEFGHIDFQQACKLRKSHRALNSRNAKLVHENDELMAENEKFKNAMIEVYCRTLGLNFSASSYAKYILEECGYDTSELPIK